MEHNQPRPADLPRILNDVVADIADLVRKEFRLARAEMSAKVATKLRSGVWLAVAAGLGLSACCWLCRRGCLRSRPRVSRCTGRR